MNINLDNVIRILKGNKNVTEIKDENNRIIWKYDPEKFETIYCYSSYEIDAGVWKNKTWNISFSATDLWSDGTNIYYTYKGIDVNNSYVGDNTNKTWISKTWYGLDNVQFIGRDVGTDGTNIYMSMLRRTAGTIDPTDPSNYYHLVLNKATDTGTAVTWNVATFEGEEVWCKDTDIYANAYQNHKYKLDKINQSWTTGDLGSLTYAGGTNIWTDGTNYYRTALIGTSQTTSTKKYNPTTNAGDDYTWNGTVPNLDGAYIFKYAGDIYFIDQESPYKMYKLNRNTATGNEITFTNQPSLAGLGRQMWNFNGLRTCVCTTKKLLW